MKKFDLAKFFYSDRFAMVFSLIISFAMWIAFSSSGFERYEKVISDIPVSVVLSESARADGLRVFSGADIKAKVSVVGNRVALGMVTKNDIQVIAKQAPISIMSPGNYTLELTAVKKSTMTDYDFSSSVSPNFITVSVDRLREVTLKIENEIKYTSDPVYFTGATTFSENQVTISGPESKMINLAKVSVKKNYEGILRSTQNEILPLTLYDFYGSEMSKDQLTLTVSEVNVIIPILFRKEVEIVPNLLDMPGAFGDSTWFASVSPFKIEIAGPEETVSKLTQVKLAPLDFSKIDENNRKFKLDIILPAGCRTMNNNYQADLSINLDNLVSRTIEITEIKPINFREGENIKIDTNSIKAKIVGPYDVVHGIKSNDLYAEVDLKEENNYIGHKELKAKIRTGDYSSCWAYGEYTVNLTITDKKG